MENQIEMSLDDIIKLKRSQNKKSQSGNRVGVKRHGGGAAGKGLRSQVDHKVQKPSRKPGGGVAKRRKSVVIQNRSQKENPKGPQSQINRTAQTSPRKPLTGVFKSLVVKTAQNQSRNRKSRGGNRRGGNERDHRAGVKGVHGGQTSSRKPGGGILKRSGSAGIQKAKYSKSVVNSAWNHAVYNGPGRDTLKTWESGKLALTNLDYGVTDSDIHELFTDCGQLKKVAVHYDRSGRSLGTADLIFERKSDALKAIKQYHGVTLDGRPMKLQFLNDGSSLIRPLSAAAASVQKEKPKVGGHRRGLAAGDKNRTAIVKRYRAAAGTAGRNRKKPALTAEQLDAELDAYRREIKS